MHRFKELKVWQKSRALVKEIYSQTADFTKTERFGITRQIRRAVLSISNNFAEGAGVGDQI
ncbi:MAG: four helix bundle protein [bacterium]|jgi:four helix bundle protein